MCTGIELEYVSTRYLGQKGDKKIEEDESIAIIGFRKIVISKDSNLKRPRVSRKRQPAEAGAFWHGTYQRLVPRRVRSPKPTVRGGVDRRMRSIRINPATLR